jgi:hypothetical protein
MLATALGVTVDYFYEGLPPGSQIESRTGDASSRKIALVA